MENLLKVIEADFNDLARNGKVKIHTLLSVPLNDKVLLHDSNENMLRLCNLVEKDDSWLYFEILDHPFDRRTTPRFESLQPDQRITPEAKEVMFSVLEEIRQERLTIPGMFTGEESGIRFEWTEPKKHLVVEIDDKDRCFIYFCNSQTENSSHFKAREVQKILHHVKEWHADCN